MVNDVVSCPRHPIVGEWAKRQTYLALGNLLASAAMLGIDACPMEGFDPAAVDRILGLSPRHLASTVLCTLGYRSPDDAYAGLAKVRMPVAELVEYR
jgi:nitroreductase